MKKLLMSILLVLSCAGPAFAFSGVLAGVMGAGSTQVASSPLYSYPGGLGVGDFQTGNGQSAGVALSSVITVGKTGNITKIGVKFYGSFTATVCKVALFDSNSSSSAVLNTGSTFVPTGVDQWYDVDIAPYAATAGQSLRVAAGCDNNWNNGYNSGGTGQFVSQSYASFPVTANWVNDAGKLGGVRIYQP